MNAVFSKTHFRQVAMLSAAGAKGRKVSLPDAESSDWHAIFHLAMRHGVLPIIGCVLLKEADGEVQHKTYDQIIEHTRMIAAKNQIKQQRIMWLIKELERAGIAARLIKGYAVADCYDRPECRRSEDTDLLIQPDQEHQAYEVLRNLGFRVDKRTATSHHAVCQHPKHGMVELHVQLYDELIHEGWFKGVTESLLNEPNVRISNAHAEYTTLGYSDHALFLAIHMVKHFIGVGINLRMMLDVALFLSTHKSEIDFARFWRIMKQLRFDCLVNCILTIMVQTGCFGWDEFPGGTVSAGDELEVFLDDLLTSINVAGNHQEENAYYEYSKAIMQQTMGRAKYCTYMIRWGLRNTKSQIWPEKEQLFVLYNVKNPKMHDLLWLRLRRLFDLPLQKIREGITPKRLLEAPKQNKRNRRLQVFEKLKMI